ncbi:MAG: CYCXC family (seleno)protein, partial [Planctomycetota bacterium]
YTRESIADVDKKASVNIDLLKGGETRPTLSPVRFVGKTAEAYKIAGENRELLDSLYCYCNCKKNFGHKSLLSCYVDTHAVDCKICQDQAFYASSRYKKGDDITRARAAVDKRFWRPLR